MSDLRSALESAFEKSESSEPVEVKSEPQVQDATIPAEKVEVKTETRSRDEAGKFKPTDKPIEKPAEPAPVAEAPVRKAPSSWKPAAQEAFLKADRGESLTPEEVKMLTAEAERRESDFHKGVSEFKTHSDRARAYDQAIAPYQAHLQAMRVDAPTAIGALLKADYTLRNSDPATKAQYFQNLAKEYGIDLSNQEVPNYSPQEQFLMQQMQELRQRQDSWQNSIAQQESERAQSALSQFTQAEKPHFEAVRNDMADLMQAGKAKTLEEAYDMAVWMRPDIRSTLIEQQRAEVQRKAEEHAHALKAKAASVSVRGSSPSAGGVQPGNGSLRDIIAAQFADN
mgnify:CR=1 FL=1